MSAQSDEVEILLVEDEKGDAKLTLLALQEANLSNHIKHVWDGAAALDYIFGTVPDAVGESLVNHPKLILLDLKLPKVGGLEVLAKVKADPRTHSIPVVIMTSSAQDKDIEESYKLGANSYIVKPIGFDRFAEMVSKLGMYWLLLNRAPQR